MQARTHKQFTLCRFEWDNHSVYITDAKHNDRPAQVGVATVATLWVPAVNNESEFGRWAFLEIDADNRHKPMQAIRKFLKSRAG